MYPCAEDKAVTRCQFALPGVSAPDGVVAAVLSGVPGHVTGRRSKLLARCRWQQPVRLLQARFDPAVSSGVPGHVTGRWASPAAPAAAAELLYINRGLRR